MQQIEKITSSDTECPDYSFYKNGVCFREICSDFYFVNIEGKCDQIECQQFYHLEKSGLKCLQETCDNQHYLDNQGYCTQETCEEGWILKDNGRRCEIVCQEYFYKNDQGTQCLQAQCQAPRYQVDKSGKNCDFIPCEDGYYQDFQTSECIMIDEI